LRCLARLKTYWRHTAGAYLVLLAATALALVIPQLIRRTVDLGIGRGDLRLLGLSVLGIIALTLLKGVMAFLHGRWTEVASQGVAYDLRNAIHRKLSELSFSYHDRTQTGQILSRAVQDVERIRFLTGRAILRLFEAGTLLVGTTAVLLTTNVRLAILALAAMPLLAYVAFRVSGRLRPLSLEVQNQLAELTIRVEQNLRGARVVKAFAQEENEIARFESENARWFDLSAQVARLRALNIPLLELIASFGMVLIVWYGGLSVMRNELTLGELVAFSTYLTQLVQPVRRLGMIIPALAMAAAAGQRVFEILDAESDVREMVGAMELPHVRGRVCFEHVSFAYFGRHRVLNDVSFEALPGQVIALLGATGSGKSTIINLIPRFYDPTTGRITIDGHDIRTVTLTSLREQIGIVLQETTLFGSTIQANIAFGRPGASEDEVVAAARVAQAHDFIMQLPGGYDSAVGEGGSTLSGGQRQRIAIARALLMDPRILILDDATSSVDTETEQQIQTALAALMQGRTAFVIAQRLSTLRRADLILVMERGRIAARGTHAELLHSSRLYAETYQKQLAPREAVTGP
jgi:ATP-binding cassette subfamily B protein